MRVSNPITSLATAEAATFVVELCPHMRPMDERQLTVKGVPTR